MDKYKDNFDDDNKMEEYKFDPNDYCRFCSGHLRGIRHLADCRRKREGYSPARVVLEKREDESKNELLNRRPLELNERNKTAKNETKEDNFEKVDRVEDKEIETKLTPEELKSVFPRLRTCTGVGDQATTEGELTSEMSRSKPREEKNHETLAEKVSKLENEEGEINAIVKEIEKAEKIYTHDMELIRQVLERQVLSPQDRLTLNKVLEQSETMMERINQAKDLIKKRKEIAKNETEKNELKVKESDKVDDKEESEAVFNIKVIRCEEEKKTVGESVKDLIKKRNEIDKNDSKIEESEKFDEKESETETSQEESGLVRFEENDISENDNEIDTKLTPEESKSVFPRLRTRTGVGDQTTTEGGLSSEMSRSVFEENDREEAFNEREDEKVQDKDGEVKEKVKNEDDDDKERVRVKEVKNEDEDDKEGVKVKDEEDKEEVENKDEDKKEKVLDDKAKVKYVKEEDNFSPPAKKIRKAQLSPLYTRGGLGPLLTPLASSMAKTMTLSDEWTKTVNVSQLLPPSDTPQSAADPTPGSGYDVSVKCWELGTNRRCPLPASIKGQYVSNVFHNLGLYGVSTPGSTAWRTTPQPPGGFKTSSSPPFRSRGKMSFSTPNPTFASRQIDVKDPGLATYPYFLFPPRENSTETEKLKSKKQEKFLSGTPSTKHRFYDFIDIMTNAIYDEYLKTSAIYNIFVEHPVQKMTF